MNPTKVVFDVKTGRVVEIPLDAAEIAEIAARQAEGEAAERALEAIEADKDFMRGANVPDMLRLIAARQQQIAADRTTLAGATMLAQVLPVVDRMLGAEDATLTALVKIARALSRLV